jgi:hypothetical protein
MTVAVRSLPYPLCDLLSCSSRGKSHNWRRPVGTLSALVQGSVDEVLESISWEQGRWTVAGSVGDEGNVRESWQANAAVNVGLTCGTRR